MLATETNKQILIVDRDVAAVEPLRQRLGEAGFVVRAITDGSAAIVAVAERPPHLVSLREVVARVCSVLRAHQYEDQSSALSCDDLVLDALLFHAMFHA